MRHLATFTTMTLGCSVFCIGWNTAYATCRTDIRPSAPDSRYVIQTGGAEVLDMQTQLIWQRCSLGQTWNGSSCTGTATSYTWKNALSAAKALGNGYRLPNIKELQSLREVACVAPKINSTVFPNTTSNSWYWSASPNDAGYGSLALGVGFGYLNYGGNSSYKNRDNVARAVRSSQ